MRVVTIGALNIVMPEPHGPQRYVDLLKDAYRRKSVVKVRGEFAAILGGFGAAQTDDFVAGEVFKFFNLDITAPWINIDERARAEADDLKLISVPENLKPNLQTFPFLLHAKKHRIFFLSRERDEHFGPTDAMRYFRQLLNQPRLTQKYGPIRVTIEPDDDTLEKIFAMTELRRLEIDVSPPNPDDFENYDATVKKRMKNQNAQRLQVTLVADSGESLKPDAETKALSKVAQSNGKVTARGRIGDGPVVGVSTQEHPLLVNETYDPNVDTSLVAVLRAANDFIAKLIKPKKGAQPQ